MFQEAAFFLGWGLRSTSLLDWLNIEPLSLSAKKRRVVKMNSKNLAIRAYQEVLVKLPNHKNNASAFGKFSVVNKC